MSDQKVPGGPPPDSQSPPAYSAGPGAPQSGYAPYPGPQGPPPPGYPAQPGGYPAQPPGYAPQAYPQQPGGYAATTVVVQQPGGAAPGGMHRYHSAPALINCQHCNATVTTSITYESGLLTWIAVGVLCLFGCWLGCCLIPFCVDPCKDVVHSCPNCKQLVGKFRQLS